MIKATFMVAFFFGPILINSDTRVMRYFKLINIHSLILLFFIVQLSACVDKKVGGLIAVEDRGRYENGDGDGGSSDDSTLPTISSVSKPSNRWYGNNQYLTFTVTYNEAVTVEGIPQFKITTDAGDRYATYYTGSGTTAIGFRYKVVTGDTDVDGIVVDNRIDLNGGNMTDASGNVADLVIGTLNTSGIYLDRVVPILLSITNVASGSYRNSNADTLSFDVTWDKDITVTGTPKIAITLGSGTAYANYASGTGTPTLTFTYTVGASDLDLDGITLVSPISISGASLRDIARNNAPRTFTVPDTSAVYVTPNSLVLWLDASDRTTLLDAQGDNANSGAFDNEVCTWNDRSYRAHNMTTHAIDTNCMSYTASALNLQDIVSGGGDGTSQCLSVSLSSGLSSTSGGSVFSVVRSDSSAQTTQTVLWGDSGVGAFPRLGFYDNLGTWLTTVGGADDYYEIGSSAIATGAWHLDEVVFNAGTYGLVIDASSETLSLGGGVLSADTGVVNEINLGCESDGSNNMNASVGEVMVFESSLNAASISHLRSILTTRWGL